MEETLVRTSKKVMQSRERVFSYHSKESVTKLSYPNPRIDGELVNRLNEEGEGLAEDEDLERRIITIMKENHYIPS